MSKTIQELVEWHDRYPGSGPWFFLISYGGRDDLGWDGMHDGPEGVAEARLLMSRVFGTRWPKHKMLIVMDAPEPGGAINEEAADIAAALVKGDYARVRELAAAPSSDTPEVKE